MEPWASRVSREGIVGTARASVAAKTTDERTEYRMLMKQVAVAKETLYLPSFGQTSYKIDCSTAMRGSTLRQPSEEAVYPFLIRVISDHGQLMSSCD